MKPLPHVGHHMAQAAADLQPRSTGQNCPRRYRRRSKLEDPSNRSCSSRCRRSHGIRLFGSHQGKKACQQKRTRSRRRARQNQNQPAPMHSAPVQRGASCRAANCSASSQGHQVACMALITFLQLTHLCPHADLDLFSGLSGPILVGSRPASHSLARHSKL